MKVKNQIIKIIILAVVFILLVNPAIFPFAPETLNAIKTQLSETFGTITNGEFGVFSVARLISAAAVIVGMWLVCNVLLFAFSHLRLRKNRSRTIIGLANSAVRYIFVLVTLVWALSILGVNLAGIFASLGILTLIIGFGAQSLIEDMVTGIFIIFEGNYNIGDIIVLDDFRGVVRKIDIRTTTIEDDAGNLKIVNNSDIRNIQNRSANLTLAVSDLSITYDTDIRSFEKAIGPALLDIYSRHMELFEDVPAYKGVESLGDSCVVVRFAVWVKESNFFPARRMLNRELKIFMDDNGFEIPFPQLDIHKK